MTDREKAIVMAYTGICTLTGTKFAIFHKYVEDIMDRPVQTIELGSKNVRDEIKEKSKADFIALCADESSSENPKMGKWVKTPKAVMGEGYMWYCDQCEHKVYQDSSKPYPSEKYCPNCGSYNGGGANDQSTM